MGNSHKKKAVKSIQYGDHANFKRNLKTGPHWNKWTKYVKNGNKAMFTASFGTVLL